MRARSWSRSSWLAGFLFVLAASAPVAADEPRTDELPVTVASPQARAAFARGRSLFYNLRTGEARAAFEEALRHDPACALAHVYRAMATRPPTAARDSIDQALKLRAKITDGERLLVDAMAAQLAGDGAAEIALREKLAALYPRDWRLLVGLGNRLFHLGRYAEAVAVLERSTEAAPDEAAPYNDLGYAYAYSNRLDDALRALRRYADRLPSEPNPHDSLGEISLKAGKVRDAIASYQKALALDPGFVIANEGLGHARLLSGEFDGARDAYRRLAAGAPSAYERFAGLDWFAATFAHEGHLDETLRQLERAEAEAVRAREPVWTVLFPTRRALALSEIGRHKEAAALADKALAAAGKVAAGPSLRNELVARAASARGIALARAGDRKAARALLELTARKMAGDVAAQRILARLSAVLEALEPPATVPALDLAAVLERFGPDPWSLSAAADARELAKDPQGAAELRAAALRLNVVTPELGYVRPRLLAGQAVVGTGARYGPMPITTRSTVALALFSEGRRLGELYKRPLALAVLEKAIALDPSFALARAYAGAYADSPDYAAAQFAEAARLVAAGAVSDAEALFIESQAADAAGDLFEKEQKLRALARLHPTDFRPAVMLGEHLLRMGRRSEAMDFLRAAAKAAPKEASPWNGLGYALAFEGRLDEAVAALRTYAELSPGESNPHDSLAEVLLLAGRAAESEAAYRRSLELSPQFVASWAGLGHARLLGNDPDGARDAYREMSERAGLGLDRASAETWSALTYAYSGAFDQAEQALARAAKDAEEQKDPFTAALLAVRRVPLLAEAGRATEALALAAELERRVARLSPAARTLVMRRALFGRGWTELSLGRNDQADATAKALVTLEGTAGHPEGRALAAALTAAVQLARNAPVEALAALEDADDRHPLVQVLRAEALEQSHQPEKAKAWRRAVQNPGANHLDLALARRRDSRLVQ
jgi:tetratricopeptide (TPR) repeat protein